MGLGGWGYGVVEDGDMKLWSMGICGRGERVYGWEGLGYGLRL